MTDIFLDIFKYLFIKDLVYFRDRCNNILLYFFSVSKKVQRLQKMTASFSTEETKSKLFRSLWGHFKKKSPKKNYRGVVIRPEICVAIRPESCVTITYSL